MDENFEKAYEKSWYERANALGREWPKGGLKRDENNRLSNHDSKLIAKAMDLVYERLNKLYKNKLNNWMTGLSNSVDGDDIVQLAAIDIWKSLEKYDPLLSELGIYLSPLIKLKQAGQGKRMEVREKKRQTLVYDDQRGTKENEEDDPLKSPHINIEEIGDTRSPEYSERGRVALGAMVINFKNLQIGAKHQKKIRLFRLQYTEQLVYISDEGKLPWECEKDLLYALDESYFRYFTVPTKESTITLRTIERAELKSTGEVIPGKSMDAPLEWNEDGFLPAGVQISFWKKEEKESLLASTISKCRKEYLEALHSFK